MSEEAYPIGPIHVTELACGCTFWFNDDVVIEQELCIEHADREEGKRRAHV